ncbi:hypothetical protein C5167_041763 [Papaver somniferum]|nr:hypothetical protein C5167_041763 [Papaver somniferum]
MSVSLSNPARLRERNGEMRNLLILG